MSKRRLYFLRILRDEDAPRTFFESADFAADIKQVLVATSSAKRYNRIWRLSKPEEIHGSTILTGKLGFVHASQSEAVLYDEDKQDFVSQETPSHFGAFVHYALDYESQYLVTEIRPPEIQPNSVRGALQKLFRESTYDFRFKVEFVSDQQALSEWLDRVVRVANFRVSMRRANPGYGGRGRDLKELFESSNASRVSVEAQAGRDESLEVDGSPLRAYADYAAEEHGRVQARGEQDDAASDFDSSRHHLTAMIETSDGEPSQSVVEKLIEKLRSVINAE